MLRRLVIRDFVIVDRLELEFQSGFGALTGETGAGKSILIDALALALGERADPGVIRAGFDKAEVTASFDIVGQPAVGGWLEANDLAAEDELMLRRIVDSGGRSRAYINGSPATVQQLRAVGEYLVDIHGQHAHQSLLRPDTQRALVDGHGSLEGAVRAVGAAWRALRDARRALADAADGSAALEREREQLAWQIDDLEALAVGEGEWEALEAEHKRLAHAASLIEGAQFALDVLAEGDGACATGVERVAARVDALASYDPALAEVAGLLQSAQAELAEAVSALRRYADRVDLDPSRLAEIERRMESLLSAARKHRTRPEALPALLVEWRERLSALVEAADLASLQVRATAAEAAYGELAGRLSEARREAARELAESVSSLMVQLSLGSGRFEAALLPLAEGGAAGLEQVEFRVAGLAGDEARPLARVASGGELSRISLAIQVVTSRLAQVPTLIFDEVDVGIGGGVAEIVGRLLAELGSERQVLCVTHLPQVAARAAWQWQVSKAMRDGAVLSSIRALDAEQRVDEVARMLGGVTVTEISREHAREMLRSTS